MANVPHSSLTGTDLHEIKGASSATTGQVPVANGSGGAPFGKLTHTSLQTTGNPFGAQLLHVREEQPNNVGSSTSAANGWQTCVINTTKTNEISATVNTNRVTLQAGTYYTDFSLPSVQNGGSGNFWKLRLRNITSGSTLIVTPTFSWTGAGSTGGAWPLTGSGRFTLAGATTLELQWYSNSSTAPGGLRSSAYTEIEVYTDLKIWKLS